MALKRGFIVHIPDIIYGPDFMIHLILKGVTHVCGVPEGWDSRAVECSCAFPTNFEVGRVATGAHLPLNACSRACP